MNRLPLLPSVSDTLVRARQSRNVFLQLTHARATRDAAEGGSGPLARTPFAVKDVFDVRGTRTSAASQVFDRRPPARSDAAAVRRMTSAGAVLIGKTTMSELAYSGVGVNERFGTPTITRDGQEYVVGGSSSGSAAAVHAGIVEFALASDTSGSARIPAAWSGVFGFRPSLGRYPTAGMTPLSPTLDAVAVIASSLDHLGVVDGLLTGRPGSPRTSGPHTFVVPHDDYLARCDGHVLNRFHDDLTRLRAAGNRIFQRRFESLDTVRTLHQIHVPIVESEAYAAFGGYLATPNLLSPPVRRRLERARERLRTGSSDKLYQAMPALRQQFVRELGDELLLSPSVEIDAPTISDLRASPDLHDEVNRRTLALTMALSYLDSPSLVVPTSAPGARIPSSLQISSSARRDGKVLDGARQLLSS